MANYTLAQLQSLSRQAGWPESLIAKAAAIWMYESAGNPRAHNPRGENSWGLAQINLPYHPTMNVAKATEPITALRYAYKLYKARPDWGDWYNSNKAYNNNLRGIAAKSRAVYAAGGNENAVTNTASNAPVITEKDVTAVFNTNLKPAENSANNIMIASAIGVFLIGVTLIARR
jgi:hypothetical protein